MVFADLSKIKVCSGTPITEFELFRVQARVEMVVPVFSVHPIEYILKQFSELNLIFKPFGLI